MERPVCRYLDRSYDWCIASGAYIHNFLVQFYEQDERYCYKAQYATEFDHSDEYVQSFSISNQDFEVPKAEQKLRCRCATEHKHQAILNLLIFLHT